MNLTYNTPIEICTQELQKCNESFYHNIINFRFEIVLLVVAFLEGVKILFYWSLEEKVRKGKITTDRMQMWKEGIEHYEKFLLIPIWFSLLVTLGLF